MAKLRLPVFVPKPLQTLESIDRKAAKKVVSKVEYERDPPLTQEQFMAEEANRTSPVHRRREG
jgi:hypothetical protein